MTKTIRKLSAALILIALLVGVFFWVTGGMLPLVNFEIGYLSGAFVIAASAFGYWQLVAGSGENRPRYELPDIVDSIDDRYGLWEEESRESHTDVKAILREEKARRKKGRKDFKTFLRSAKPALSLYRIGAYLFLIAGVFYLIKSDMFEPIHYLAGAGLAPLAMAVFLFFSR